MTFASKWMHVCVFACRTAAMPLIPHSWPVVNKTKNLHLQLLTWWQWEVKNSTKTKHAVHSIFIHSVQHGFLNLNLPHIDNVYTRFYDVIWANVMNITLSHLLQPISAQYLKISVVAKRPWSFRIIAISTMIHCFTIFWKTCKAPYCGSEKSFETVLRSFLTAAI